MSSENGDFKDDDSPVYCPRCLEERGENVELEISTEWRDRAVVPVYWSQMTMYVIESCPRCGYRSEYEAPNPHSEPEA